jgi:hypothetical protein
MQLHSSIECNCSVLQSFHDAYDAKYNQTNKEHKKPSNQTIQQSNNPTIKQSNNQTIKPAIKTARNKQKHNQTSNLCTYARGQQVNKQPSQQAKQSKVATTSK